MNNATISAHIREFNALRETVKALRVDEIWRLEKAALTTNAITIKNGSDTPTTHYKEVSNSHFLVS